MGTHGTDLFGPFGDLTDSFTDDSGYGGSPRTTKGSKGVGVVHEARDLIGPHRGERRAPELGRMSMSRQTPIQIFINPFGVGSDRWMICGSWERRRRRRCRKPTFLRSHY
jgi:hypothetical protein